VGADQLLLGFVAPIGTDIAQSLNEFRNYFHNCGYNIIEIKVTDVFKVLEKHLKPARALATRPMFNRYQSHIDYGNQIRAFFEDDSALAAITMGRLIRKRLKKKISSKDEAFRKNIYLIHQFKRKEKVDLFRSVYGRLFFQISIYSRRGARVDYLSRKFSEDAAKSDPKSFRSEAEAIVERDENEIGADHGQRVSTIFHDGDLIINTDINDPPVRSQVERFCNLLMGSNQESPTKIEYGMFVAKAAALRTLDLSRQVGAAIFSGDGEIITMGSNEVPKGTGGTYWGDEKFDDREFKRGIDSNDKRKKELLRELISNIGTDANVDALMKIKRVIESRFMDALEYGRIIHAEMSAICDAARLGKSVRSSRMFCTTFPCHMCAKHIVASGIKDVIFLEPYPKSLASDLHSDAIAVEGSDRGAYQDFPAVDFVHFYGVSPRRYREIFERAGRKDEESKFQPWKDGLKQPIVDIKIPFYAQLEEVIVKTFVDSYLKRIAMAPELLDDESPGQVA
jgi:deoxycytidylate deaminase